MRNLFLRKTLLLILCCSSYSCAFIKPTPDSLSEDISHWLANNQYDKIDYAINKINLKESPEFKKLLNKKSSFKRKKQKYIDKVSKTAKKHKQESNWQLAIDEYDDALNNLNSNRRLESERKKLITQRNVHVANLRKELLINRANALISYKKTYSALHNLIPDDNSAQYDISQYEDEKEDLANELQKCGEHAIKNNHYTIARDCYVLSNQLMPSKTKLSFVDNIKKQLKDRENKQRFKELLSAYETAYVKKDYKNARTALQTLTAIDPKHKKASKLLINLNNEIDKLVDKMISEGKEQYSKKKINQALKTWQQAKRFKPDNKELIQLIIRAEKVSKKLQKLEDSQ